MVGDVGSVFGGVLLRGIFTLGFGLVLDLDFVMIVSIPVASEIGCSRAVVNQVAVLGIW